VPQPSCTEVDITHTNMPMTEAARALQQYLETIEEGGGESQMSQLVVSGQMSRDLRDSFGGPLWDVFVMGDAFSYTISCWRYVELAGYHWNVLLCQMRAGHGFGSFDPDPRACGPLTQWSNGSIPAASDWEEPKLRVSHYDHQQTADIITPEYRAQRSNSLTRLMAGPGLGAIDVNITVRLRQQIEEMWPSDSWNVILEQGGGHPNRIEDAKEQFHVLDARSEAVWIVFSRGCWHPP